MIETLFIVAMVIGFVAFVARQFFMLGYWRGQRDTYREWRMSLEQDRLRREP